MNELTYYSVINNYNIFYEFVIQAALGVFLLGFGVGSNGSTLKLAGGILIGISFFNVISYLFFLQSHM